MTMATRHAFVSFYLMGRARADGGWTVEDSVLHHADLMRGGELRFTMSPRR